MNLDEILSKDELFFQKESNDNLKKYISVLVNEFEKNKKEIKDFLLLIENEPVEENPFFLDMKLQKYKQKMLYLSGLLERIENRWEAIMLIFANRVKTNN